jgi:hypothetical protein
MDDPKALALFQEVLKKTIAKKLAWQPTADEEMFVATMLGKYTLTLSSYTSLGNWGEHEGPPVISLQDDVGNKLVEISSDIVGVRVEDLRTLLVFARRIAFNADEKIDELLGELKKGDEVES